MLAPDENGQIQEVVDLFAPADVTEIETVARQREAVWRFHGLDRRGT
ncbi:hypothetical protein [Cryptosporangium minutisporangium]|uniref:Uncharacterized protein n=1 Tax=Cryptosporangium minutisporangium TaxID=113569 RepID=A0ABP6SR50_9ACTN